LEKMPTTSVRRLMSQLGARSGGRVQPSSMLGRARHIAHRSQPRRGSQQAFAAWDGALIGELAPLRSGGLGIVLGKRGGDQAETTRRALLPAPNYT
jgi:hypothetical protein